MIIENYNKIYNNYCISYLGNSFEIPIILFLIRKNLELSFPELKIFYGFNNQMADYFQKQKNIVNFDFLINHKNKFGCIYECKENFNNHPLDSVLLNINIDLKIKKIPIHKELPRNCLIVSKNDRFSINESKLNLLQNYIIKRGFNILPEDSNPNLNEIGCVAGVESPELYLGAYRGLETILVDDGFCSDIYRKIFPENIIFNQ